MVARPALQEDAVSCLVPATEALFFVADTFMSKFIVFCTGCMRT